jgi:DNA replication protein DnaC
MLNQQTIGKLRELRLNGMAGAFELQLSTPITHSLSFEERFGLIVDQECTHRSDQRMKRLLKGAKLQLNACVEDIDHAPGRGLDRSQMASLTTCDWVSRGLNLILSGATGTGKTWLACAFGNKACRLGKTVFFQRTPLLLEDLHLAHADGSFRKRLAQLAKFDLLILDDFGSGAITSQGRADLLEVVDSRVNGRSIIVTSQMPVEKWHDFLSSGNPTAADAILDRLVSGSGRVPLSGESMRKRMKDKFGP